MKVKLGNLAGSGVEIASHAELSEISIVSSHSRCPQNYDVMTLYVI